MRVKRLKQKYQLQGCRRPI